LTLIRNSADSEVAAIEQTTTYTMAEKRSFELTYDDGTGLFEEPTIESTISVSYLSKPSIGDDTRYNNKKVSLIISEVSGNVIPKDTQIFDGTNYYNQNGKGRFIIPLGNVDDNKNMDLQLISDTLKENEIGVNLKLGIYASDDINNPCMGDNVVEIENIKLNAIELPAIRIDIDKNSYTQEEFTGNLELEYETIELEGCNLTLELQKKVSSNSYVTQTNLLTTVDGKSENTNGVFDLDLSSSGNIKLEFSDEIKEQYGTYRILIKLKNDENVIFEIPYNFMIVK